MSNTTGKSQRSKSNTNLEPESQPEDLESEGSSRDLRPRPKSTTIPPVTKKPKKPEDEDSESQPPKPNQRSQTKEETKLKKPNKPEDEDPESQPPKWVAQFHKDLADDICKKLDVKLNSLEAKLEPRFSDLETSVVNIKSHQDQVLQRIKGSESLIQANSNRLEKLENLLSEKDGTIRKLTNEIEDLRNRSMRKTLVFYGFPEADQESWDDCKTVIVKHLEACKLKNISTDRAYRVNRNTGKDSVAGPRPIYAEFVKWQDSNRVLNNAGKISKNRYKSDEGSHAIKVEQLFSKHTFSERKKMLKIRRYFLQQDSSLKIRLTYPASLFLSILVMAF